MLLLAAEVLIALLMEVVLEMMVEEGAGFTHITSSCLLRLCIFFLASGELVLFLSLLLSMGSLARWGVEGERGAPPWWGGRLPATSCCWIT